MSNIVSVQNYFANENNLSRIQQACGSVQVNEQVMDAVQIIANNTKLQECTPASIVGAVITASRLGVSLDPNMKHSYLIPYGKKCQFEVSYMGLIDVANRLGDIRISSHEVYSNDTFEPQLGSEKKLNHIPNCFGDRGDLIGVYAIAYFADGSIDFETLDLVEIEKCRKASKNPNGSVYKLWDNEMAKKSAIRRLYKRLPKNKDLSRVASYDEKSQIGADTSDIIDIDGVEIPQEPVDLSEMVD